MSHNFRWLLEKDHGNWVSREECQLHRKLQLNRKYHRVQDLLSNSDSSSRQLKYLDCVLNLKVHFLHRVIVKPLSILSQSSEDR